MKLLNDMLGPTPDGGEHEQRDREKLRYHRRVAELLRADPESVLQVARSNLDRWLQTDRASKPYYEEWEMILRHRPVEEIAALLTEDSANARRLRQSSPFVGVMPQAERDEFFAQR